MKDFKNDVLVILKKWKRNLGGPEFAI